MLGVSHPEWPQRSGPCYFVGVQVRASGAFPGEVDPSTRELCQSVCLSATCLTRRPSRIFANICRASAHQRRSSCLPIGKPGGHAGSHLWTTPIAPSLRKRSAGSTSNHSKDARWRSARRARVRNARRGQDLAALVVHDLAAHRLGDSGARDPAALRHARLTVAAARPDNGPAILVRMHRRRTSANPAEKNLNAVRAAQSRSVR